VREGLRHVPVLLAARLAQQRFGQPTHQCLQRVTDGFLLGQQSRSRARHHAILELSSQQRDAARGPVEDAPAGEDVRRIGLEGRDPGRACIVHRLRQRRCRWIDGNSPEPPSALRSKPRVRQRHHGPRAWAPLTLTGDTYSFQSAREPVHE
jgi:hypothetical protein